MYTNQPQGVLFYLRWWEIAGKFYLTTLFLILSVHEFLINFNGQKSVRSLALHPALNMLASGSTDNIKIWKLPNGDFMQNLSGHNTMINSLVVNEDGVIISGGI